MPTYPDAVCAKHKYRNNREATRRVGNDGTKRIAPASGGGLTRLRQATSKEAVVFENAAGVVPEGEGQRFLTGQRAATAFVVGQLDGGVTVQVQVKG